MAAVVCFTMLMLFTSIVSSRPTPCDQGSHDFLPCSTRGWTLNGPASYIDPTGLGTSPLPFLFFSSTNSDATAMTSSSAIDRVVPHPDGSWFAASVNGGVWKTHNISESSPHWHPVTDFDSNTCPVSAALVDSAGCSRSRRRYRSLALASARCTLTVSTGSCM
jgi:hypothetical protein